MDNRPTSPFAREQQQMSAQIYRDAAADKLDNWRCSSRIPKDLALNIYQQNLHGGVTQHLRTNFPVAHAYIGNLAYQAICTEYLKASPPDQPIFTIYAAHFPGFLLEYGEQHPEQLIWSAAARLAQIDFFHHNTFCEDQLIEVEDIYYQLWINTKSLVDNDDGVNTHGLYRRIELHPEQYHQQASATITLVTFWENEELLFRRE